MTKKQEMTDPNSCLCKADNDEPIFVLRGKDPLIVDTILGWITSAEEGNLHADKIEEALDFISEVIEWRKKKRGG